MVGTFKSSATIEVCYTSSFTFMSLLTHVLSNMVINQKGVWLMYLPAYCPELNPIEMCFSVVKAQFKCTQVLENSGPEAKWAVRQMAFDCITGDLLAKLYHGCGYRLPEGMVPKI